jgi:hypothetical protein
VHNSSINTGGSHAKVEILASLVASSSVLPGHFVIATRRLYAGRHDCISGNGLKVFP